MYSIAVSVGAAALLFVLLVIVYRLVKPQNLQSNEDGKRSIQSKGKDIAELNAGRFCRSYVFGVI